MTYFLLAVVLLLVAIGATGILLRRNPLIMLMSIELMLNAANLLFVTVDRLRDMLDGQLFALTLMAIAAAEVAVGLALVVMIFREEKVWIRVMAYFPCFGIPVRDTGDIIPIRDLGKAYIPNRKFRFPSDDQINMGNVKGLFRQGGDVCAHDACHCLRGDLFYDPAEAKIEIQGRRACIPDGKIGRIIIQGLS